MPDEKKPLSLRRRIAPSQKITLNLSDDDGATLSRTFFLSLDFNAACYIQEHTGGKSLLDGPTWDDVSPKTVSIMFYAAILAKHPEFDTRDADNNPTPEGLEVIRSLMDAGNMIEIHEALFEAFVKTLTPDGQARIKKARADAAAELKARIEEAQKRSAGTLPNGKPAVEPAPEEVIVMDAPQPEETNQEAAISGR